MGSPLFWVADIVVIVVVVRVDALHGGCGIGIQERDTVGGGIDGGEGKRFAVMLGFAVLLQLSGVQLCDG